MKSDEWVAESRPVAVELTDKFDHADYLPTVVSQMEGFSLMGRLQVASKELWLAMAKEVR